jgi:enhancing lycopene biosynthesis protein 2
MPHSDTLALNAPSLPKGGGALTGLSDHAVDGIECQPVPERM